MFGNYNEIELLSLMLNKDKFLEYITQRYNENNCCTQLEPLIWAIHFNIPKYQRLPLLENILLQSQKYIKTKYSFLPEKQILGKSYEVLGIPTICGEPNKYFLKAYKKYKSYYPMRCMKNKITSELDNDDTCDSKGEKTSQHCYKVYPTPPTVYQEITSSTPVTNKISRFEINSFLSPIRIHTEEKHHTSSTNKFYDKSCSLKNIHNSLQNNVVGEQMLSIPTNLELSSDNILNTSPLMFNDIQDFEVTETNNMDNTQNQMFFISRNPKHIQDSNNTELSCENDLSNIWSEESLRSLRKHENSVTSIYFDDLKKEEYKELKFETPKKLSQKGKSTEISKECLSEKIKTNLETTKTQKNNKSKIKKSSRKFEMNKLCMRKKQIFSDISLSDLDNTLQIPVTIKSIQGTNKYHKKIEQDALNFEWNDTWAKNIKNLSADLESSSNNNSLNMTANTNSSLKLNNLEHDKNLMYNVMNTSHTSSSVFSKDNVSLPDLKSNNSHQLESIRYKFINESQDSCDSNYSFKENFTKNNKLSITFDKILFDDIPETSLKNNLSLLSAIDTSLSSICTVNTSTHTAHKVQSK